MKYSHQRELILQIIQENKGHLTAKEVYDKVRKRLPNISLGTVYRNLNVLDENHQIRRIVVPYGRDEFDYNPIEHSHFFCKICEHIYDLDQKVDEKMKELVEKTTGYCITNTSVVFKGICHKCQDRKEG